MKWSIVDSLLISNTYCFLNSYRKLSLSTQLYMEIFKSVTSSTVAFDVIKNSTAKVIESSPILKLLKLVLPLSITVKEQKSSYNVVTSTAEEQFERLVINRSPVKTAVVAYETLNRILKNKYFIIIPIIICIAAYFLLMYLKYKM